MIIDKMILALLIENQTTRSICHPDVIACRRNQRALSYAASMQYFISRTALAAVPGNSQITGTNDLRLISNIPRCQDVKENQTVVPSWRTLGDIKGVRSRSFDS